MKEMYIAVSPYLGICFTYTTMEMLYFFLHILFTLIFAYGKLRQYK